MPLDPSIILGAKPVQFDMAQFSPINTLTTAMKFKQADQETQLNALKMREYERTREEEEGTRNYLAKADLSTPEGRMGLRKFGKTGLAYEKSLSEAETAGLAQKKTKFEVQDARRKFVAQAQRDTSQNPSDANITAYKEDLMMNDLFTDAEKAQMAAGADKLLAMPVNERQAFMASQGASASELKPSLQQINQGGQTQVLRVPAFGGAPTSVGTYADVPLPAAVQAQKMQTATAGAPKVSYGPQEKAEKIKYGELLIDDFKNIKTQAAVAARSLPAIESNLAILDKGFDTGFGTETVAAGAKVLGALGVQNAKDFATDAQTFLASANAAVLQRQLEQKGPQTESDAQRITATGAQLGNTKDANKFVLNVAKAQLQRDLKQREFYAAWRAKNETFEGAEDAWYAGDGGKSLFESPSLKKYGPSVVDQIPGQSRAAPPAAPSLAQERAAAQAAIAAGAPPAAVRQRFKQNTGQEF
jgi:hypothetical protein